MNAYSCVSTEEFLDQTATYRDREPYLTLSLLELASAPALKSPNPSDPTVGYVVRHAGEITGAAFRAEGGHLAIGPVLHEGARVLGRCVGKFSNWIGEVTCPEGVLGPFLDGYKLEDTNYPGFVAGYTTKAVFVLDRDALRTISRKIRHAGHDVSSMVHLCGSKLLIYVPTEDAALEDLVRELAAMRVGTVEWCYIE